MRPRVDLAVGPPGFTLFQIDADVLDHRVSAAPSRDAVHQIEPKTLVPLPHAGAMAISKGHDSAPVGIRSDATYLITGGFGGLGMEVARWLVENGARHLVLASRSGARRRDPATQLLSASGACVIGAKADVSTFEDVSRLLSTITGTMPPLAGIVHAAGVLDDCILEHLTPDRFARVMAPKVLGAWNLHLLTRTMPLDFFVLFSSVSALLGSPGQGSYSAANAFMDGLANYRRAHGLPALSVNWGPWSEVGMAARTAARGRSALPWLRGTPPGLCTALLGSLLRDPLPQVGVLSLTTGPAASAAPSASWPRFLTNLMSELGPADSDCPIEPASPPALTRAAVLARPPTDREPLVRDYLWQQLARVLDLPSSRRAAVEARQSLTSAGLDSLMALEVKNVLNSDLQVDVPLVAFLQEATLSSIARLVLQHLELGSTTSTGATATTSDMDATVATLSAREVDALLSRLSATVGT
jgi:NAD(P)-dependent dehydrogenase (short-subunit alcohol dehydrogenase family)